MCGIVGFWKFKAESKDLLQDSIERMTGKLTHRGPDDTGFYIDEKEGIALGHRRLSILDLSFCGHQPMECFSSRYVIVYNGEVYNFNEIRKSIEREGIKFKSSSDTEVILAAISRWGLRRALSTFNGMFAFCMWDKKEKKLYLVRDRIGIKPLYFGIQKGVLFFASELKALCANRLFEPEVNRDALSLFFRHNYIPTPYSIYRGIQKLKPGHYMVIDKNLNMDICRYWNVEEIAEKGIKKQLNLSEKECISELEKLLLDSISKRMIADVPLGAFLSGGVDSSTVVALMQAQSSISVKTFTIGFYEEGFNEAKFAGAVAKHLGTEHTELYVTPKEAIEAIPLLGDIYDEPFSDSSQIPTFLISRLTRRFVTVSLSGDGGDEIFGGYNRYFLANSIWSKIKWLSPFLKANLVTSLESISTAKWNKLSEKFGFLLPDVLKQRMSAGKLCKLTDILKSSSPDELYLKVISHYGKPEDLVLNSREPETILRDESVKKKIPNFIDRMMFLDLMTYLPDDILTKVDRASMRVSLEVRVPILDHRIVEFSKRLPLSLKMRKRENKWILRQVLYKYVPSKLIERAKMGFAIPLDAWLRDYPLRDWVEDLLDEKKIREDGFLNPEFVRKLWQEYLNGRHGCQSLLWNVLMFQAWKEKWI